LFFFGGISVMENPKNKELVSPSKELKISLAGPLSNIVIGIVLLAINYFVFGSVSGVVDPESFVSIGSWVSVLLNSIPTVLFLIGLLNLVLGIFNLLPIYPMDGGRVLRAWLAQKQSYEEATKTTVSIGKNFAIIMAIISIFTLHWWLALLSLFLYISAAEEGKMLKTTSLLEKIFVQEIMTTTVDTVEESMTLNDFIQFVFQKKHPGYPVVKNGNVIGMVTVDDARFVNEAERYAFTIKDIMKESVSIDKEATGLEALNEMGLKKVGRLIVLDEEKNMVGILSRADLMTAIYLKESFKKD
ncbi:MAG: CBS domain-containing protein, partial [Methanimicrococcus sp.]|nr:CBS domain-containing protein [Methanimicrococcus sp.]